MDRSLGIDLSRVIAAVLGRPRFESEFPALYPASRRLRAIVEGYIDYVAKAWPEADGDFHFEMQTTDVGVGDSAMDPMSNGR